MSNLSQVLSTRKEVTDFLRASEHLVCAALEPNQFASLTKNEADLVAFYLAEVAKVLSVKK